MDYSTFIFEYFICSFIISIETKYKIIIIIIIVRKYVKFFFFVTKKKKKRKKGGGFYIELTQLIKD